MKKYYILYDENDLPHYAKMDGEKEYEYIEGNGWVESDILLSYLWPTGPMFGMYQEMTPEEAMGYFHSIGLPIEE